MSKDVSEVHQQPELQATMEAYGGDDMVKGMEENHIDSTSSLSRKIKRG